MVRTGQKWDGADRGLPPQLLRMTSRTHQGAVVAPQLRTETESDAASRVSHRTPSRYCRRVVVADSGIRQISRQVRPECSDSPVEHQGWKVRITI